MKFAAIDFETANRYRNSACAVGLVTVENGRIIERSTYLIRPPSRIFEFTYIHGIRWEDVKDEPTFGELWPEISRQFQGIDFLAAHNASFDKSVLKACCTTAGIEVPEIPFNCTMKLSRQLWSIYPTKLSDVCRYFSIPLIHHKADSDSEACAQIMIRALSMHKDLHRI